MNMRLVACYQPLCDQGETAHEAYGREVEEQNTFTSNNEWLMFEGDYYSHMGIGKADEPKGRIRMKKIDDRYRNGCPNLVPGTGPLLCGLIL